MTLIVKVGRRVPKSWYRRNANKVKGLLTFQENTWQMITQSFSLAKRKTKNMTNMSSTITREYETEDMFYQIEWRIVTIQGTPEVEKEQLEQFSKIYDKLGKIFKKEFPADERLAKCFKTKLLSQTQLKEAYEKGYSAMEENNVANKLLEMGILITHEFIEDYNTRTEVYVN